MSFQHVYFSLMIQTLLCFVTIYSDIKILFNAILMKAVEELIYCSNDSCFESIAGSNNKQMSNE